MGIESVSYWYRPSDCDAVDLERWLRDRGAVPGSRAHAYVLADDRYWFDVLLRSTAGKLDVVQLRVAVTNPLAALPVLCELLVDMSRRFGGSVRDLAGDRVFNDLSDADTDDLLVGFLTRRSEFIEFFGDHEWPISAEEVFGRLREERAE